MPVRVQWSRFVHLDCDPTNSLGVNAPSDLNMKEQPGVDAADLETVAKLIVDLTALVSNLLACTPAAKPWQQQLRRQLLAADVHLQVLRMTIVLERADEETLDAARKLAPCLGLAAAGVGQGRADHTTRDGVRLSATLARHLNLRLSTLASPKPETAPSS